MSSASATALSAALRREVGAVVSFGEFAAGVETCLALHGVARARARAGGGADDAEEDATTAAVKRVLGEAEWSVRTKS